MPLAERSGDFLYASDVSSTSDQICIATTDWCATNQNDYFGTTHLAFEETPGLEVKLAAARALLRS